MHSVLACCLCSVLNGLFTRTNKFIKIRSLFECLFFTSWCVPSLTKCQLEQWMSFSVIGVCLHCTPPGCACDYLPNGSEQDWPCEESTIS